MFCRTPPGGGEARFSPAHPRHFEVVGDFIPRHPAALQVNGFAVDPGLDLALYHQRSERRRHHTKQQHQQHTADGKPFHDVEKAFEEDTQHRDGLAEPVERAIIQTLPDESDWSSPCCVAF